MSHPDVETLMRHAEGTLKAAESEGVANHLDSCQACRERGGSMRAFAARLNTQWLGARLGTIMPQERNCPSVEQLGRYFLDEIAAAEGERLSAHVEGCRRCQEVLKEMEAGTATLVQADPLGVKEAVATESWRGRLRAVLDLMPRPAWAVATVAVALAFMGGSLLGPILMGPSIISVPVAEKYRIAKPAFGPSSEVPAFGIAPSVKLEADKHFREAMAFYAQPDFPDKAIPKLKEAVAVDPRHDQAQFWLGITYLLKGETQLAIRPLEEAVRLAPGKVDYKQYLVWAYLRAGEAEKALRLQTETLEKR